MGITLKRENVVKIADTEESAEKLEESGFQRVEVPAPAEKVQEKEKASTITITEENEKESGDFEVLPPSEELIPPLENVERKEEKPSGKKDGRKA